MSTSIIPSIEHSANRVKRSYRSPRLMVYGKVPSLTAAATGTIPETRRRGDDPSRLRIF